MARLLNRPLIIGSTGQLGSELMREFADTPVVGLDHTAIEIEDSASVERVFSEHAPTLVINTAAYHNVEECERNPERAFSVNALAVDRLAAAAARAGAVFATMSSDYVFDGAKHAPYTERDAARPLNVYGISKYAGELAARRHSARHVVFRTSGLYGLQTSTQKGHTFVDRLLKQAQAGETPRIVTDVVVSTSYVPDIAAAMRRVLEREKFGIVHVANAGACSWYDYAAHALRVAGFSITPQRAGFADFPSSTARPRYSVLALDALELLGIRMPSWEDALSRYIVARTTTLTTS